MVKVDKNKYAQIHRWLTRQIGKATMCENETCDGTSKSYHHALKKGCEYEKNVGNFICLCVKCHKNYDWKPEFSEHRIGVKHSLEARKKISDANKGKTISSEQKRKLSVRFSGENNPMFGISVSGENSSWYGRKHTEESKKKMSKSHAVYTDDMISEIRQMVANGKQQKEVAYIFGISRASVCRIINFKRYI